MDADLEPGVRKPPARRENENKTVQPLTSGERSRFRALCAVRTPVGGP